MQDIKATQKAYPLAMVNIGEDVSIVSFSSGKKLQQKLKDIGLMVGSRVRVLKNDFGCPLLIAVGDARVVLGQGMAHKIMTRSVA